MVYLTQIHLALYLHLILSLRASPSALPWGGFWLPLLGLSRGPLLLRTTSCHFPMKCLPCRWIKLLSCPVNISFSTSPCHVNSVRMGLLSFCSVYFFTYIHSCPVCITHLQLFAASIVMFKGRTGVERFENKPSGHFFNGKNHKHKNYLRNRQKRKGKSHFWALMFTVWHTSEGLCQVKRSLHLPISPPASSVFHQCFQEAPSSYYLLLVHCEALCHWVALPIQYLDPAGFGPNEGPCKHQQNTVRRSFLLGLVVQQQRKRLTREKEAK